MSLASFEDWVSAHSTNDRLWFIKRLSANDTLATDSHQAGPYLPKRVFFHLFPTVCTSEDPNPERFFQVQVAADVDRERIIRAIWYNQRTRDECRLTRWGGASSPVLDRESTGSVCIFSFFKPTTGDVQGCDVWVCNFSEEQRFEDLYGEVEPGLTMFFYGESHSPVLLPDEGQHSSCVLTPSTMPQAWRVAFPTGAEIVSKVVGLRPMNGRVADERLIARRDCEFQMFRSIEEIHVLPRARMGFTTVEDFIAFSNSVTNRRKTRSGQSLELHLAAIFTEEGVSYSRGEVSEGKKRPDFLFPSANAYRAGYSPLHMLGAKTTCKDRWRQILNEADLVPRKHLMTLQEGVSLNQFNEMTTSGVVLVVPKSLHKAYPLAIRPSLLTLEKFVAELAC